MKKVPKLKDQFREDEVKFFQEAFDNPDIPLWSLFFEREIGENFTFAAIQTMKYLRYIGNNQYEFKFIEDVKNKLGDTENFEVSEFFNEILQNSLDHHSNSDIIKIDCELTNEELKYTHNGLPFGFERHPTSTLQGLFTIGTNLKKFDFRVGMFGIGFKSWCLFYRKFKLTTICEGRKLTAEISVKPEGNVGPGEQFRLESWSFDYDTKEENTIQFLFTEPVNSGDISDQVGMILKTCENTLKTSTMDIEMTLNYNGECMLNSSSRVTPYQINETSYDRIQVTDKEYQVSETIAIPTNIEGIKGKYVHSYWDKGRNNHSTTHEWLQSKANDYVGEIQDTSHWYKLPRIYIDSIFDQKEDVKPCLSVLMPVSNSGKSSSGSGIRFDARFELNSNRKDLSSNTNLTVNKEILHQMTLNYFELMKEFLKLTKNGKQPSDRLPFFDLTNSIKNVIGDVNYSSLRKKFEGEYKKTIDDFLVNLNRDNIRLSGYEPRKFPLPYEKFVPWLKNNLQFTELAESFPEVPAYGNEFIYSTNSLAVDCLDAIEKSELITRLAKFDKVNAFLKFINGEEDLRIYALDFPLENGSDCTIIVPNTELNDALKVLLESLGGETNRFKMIWEEKHPEDFIKYQEIHQMHLDKGSSKNQVLYIKNESSTEDVVSFLWAWFGGNTLCEEDFNTLAEITNFSQNNVVSEISMWDGESFEDSYTAIVSIPLFDKQNIRAIEREKKLMVGGITKLKDTKHGPWGLVNRLPKIVNDGELVILKQKPGIKFSQDDIKSMIIGEPVFKNSIIDNYFEYFLRDSSGIVKVNSSDNDAEKITNTWKGGLPMVLEVKPLSQFGDFEYDPRECVNNNNEIIRDDLELTNSRRYTDVSLQSKYEMVNSESPEEVKKESQEFFNELCRSKIIKNESRPKLTSSGFILGYSFCHECIPDDEEEDYSGLKTISFSVSNSESFSVKPPKFAFRIGQSRPRSPAILAGNMRPNIAPRSESLWAQLRKKGVLVENPHQYVPKLGEVKRENFTDFTIDMFNLVPVFEEFVNRDGFPDDLYNWFNNFNYQFQENSFSKKISSSDATVERYKNCHPDDIRWQNFLDTLFEPIDFSDIEKMMHRKMEEDVEKLIDNLNNPKRDPDKLYLAFESFKKGTEYKGNKSTENNLSFISDEFLERYFDPRKEKKSKFYQKWRPNKDFRVIKGNVSRKLISSDKENKRVSKLLLDNTEDIAVEKLVITEDIDYLEVPKMWEVSFQLCVDLLMSLNSEYEEYGVAYSKVNESDECYLLGKSNVSIGKSGWDIRIQMTDKKIVFLESGNGQTRFRRGCLSIATQKFLRITTSLNERNVYRELEKFSREESSEPNIFDLAAVADWDREYDKLDIDDYIKRCTKLKIEKLYGDILLGLKEIKETSGRPSINSEADKLLKMNSKSSTKNDGPEYSGDFAIDHYFKSWYGNKSMAADEPIIGPDHLSALKKNIFLFHHENAFKDNSGKRERWMKKVGLDQFFGSTIQVGTIFGRLLDNKDIIQLADYDSKGLKGYIDEIIDGKISIPRNKILHLESALMVSGEQCGLRIHIFHLVAMAAMQEFMDEHMS